MSVAARFRREEGGHPAESRKYAWGCFYSDTLVSRLQHSFATAPTAVARLADACVRTQKEFLISNTNRFLLCNMRL